MASRSEWGEKKLAHDPSSRHQVDMKWLVNARDSQHALNVGSRVAHCSKVASIHLFVHLFVCLTAAMPILAMDMPDLADHLFHPALNPVIHQPSDLHPNSLFFISLRALQFVQSGVLQRNSENRPIGTKKRGKINQNGASVIFILNMVGKYIGEDDIKYMVWELGLDICRLVSKQLLHEIGSRGIINWLPRYRALSTIFCK
ncbi:uncharacterized protein BYT42DRAFT_561163 [Radiomyces spectabilis]|uniref:uncharacterized protein n=1 Tax=Radiomyces spectabilis TaxID=64574 RepID=UPI00221FFBE9|nr:uncharacterized protein BYT42DRAFT_561163 [Radiomyces spectabilis]KAI8388772.1 hypothetical protein BYT42DRAFT_561163 [Radiomyces spectabilis]